MAYGANIVESFRRVAGYCGQNSRGSPAGGFAYEATDRIRLHDPPEAAKVLGLTLPPALLAEAEEVIE
jgi:putative tryptophan/tyrosine transport system substrate-binding protein